MPEADKRARSLHRSVDGTEERHPFQEKPMITSIEKSVEVRVPARTAYNQWTQFEEIPRFLPRVKEVRQVDDRHLRWREELGDEEREWTMEICEQIPDKRIAWKSAAGPQSCGVVTFHRLSQDHCKIMLQVDFEPSAKASTEAVALAGQGIEQDLVRFKHFIESRGKETGAWRGAVPNPDERPPA